MSRKLARVWPNFVRFVCKLVSMPRGYFRLSINFSKFFSRNDGRLIGKKDSAWTHASRPDVGSKEGQMLSIPGGLKSLQGKTAHSSFCRLITLFANLQYRLLACTMDIRYSQLFAVVLVKLILPWKLVRNISFLFLLQSVQKSHSGLLYSSHPPAHLAPLKSFGQQIKTMDDQYHRTPC